MGAECKAYGAVACALKKKLSKSFAISNLCLWDAADASDATRMHGVATSGFRPRASCTFARIQQCIGAGIDDIPTQECHIRRSFATASGTEVVTDQSGRRCAATSTIPEDAFRCTKLETALARYGIRVENPGLVVDRAVPGGL